jgi:hypothetical protein
MPRIENFFAAAAGGEQELRGKDEEKRQDKKRRERLALQASPLQRGCSSRMALQV